MSFTKYMASVERALWVQRKAERLLACLPHATPIDDVEEDVGTEDIMLEDELEAEGLISVDRDYSTTTEDGVDALIRYIEGDKRAFDAVVFVDDEDEEVP